MNTPVHSASSRASQSHMTRRDALASVGALALAASGSAALASEPQNSSELDRLIAAYVAAEEVWIEAENAKTDLMQECRRSLRESPVFVDCLGAKPWAIELNDAGAHLDSIITGHTSDEVARLMLLRGQNRQLADLQAAFAAALSNEVTNLERLRAAQKEIRTREADAGLLAATSREEAADIACKAAFDAVLSYRPKTIHEVHRYFDFCRSENAFGRHSSPGERHWTMIFDALSSPAASTRA